MEIATGQTLILKRAAITRPVSVDRDVMEHIDRAFRTLATQPVVMPPVLRLDVVEYRGEIDVKTAYIPGIMQIAIKISPGYFDNPALGLASLNGLMVVLDARTGLLSALLLDDGYLTDARTAAAGAVAARALARADASVAAIIGTGTQARMQAQALTLVRPIEEFRVWGRAGSKAAALAASLTATLGVSARAVESIRAAIDNADIVVTTTPSPTPLVEAAWLRPGQHVTAVGADSEHKNEIDPAVFARLACYVPDRLSQCRVMGELRAALTAGIVAPATSFADLGDVLVGNAPGRERDTDITLCDLTGTGAQDTAIAALTLERALAATHDTFRQAAGT